MKQIIRISFFLLCLFSISKSWGQPPAISVSVSGNTIGCAPHTIALNISGVSGNSANTTYQLNFGDGSPVLNYTQATIPSSVSHTYTTISCGQTSVGIQNSFGATITASNSLGSTSGNISPIRISKKPNASFTLSQSSICAGSPITFFSISDPGVTYSGSGSICNSNPLYYWAVTGPSAGTVVSGTLGYSGTFPANINAWATGSSPLTMQFATPGSYQMKLSVGNSCGIDDTTLNFTVFYPSIPNAGIDQSLCIGSSPVLLNGIPSGGIWSGNSLVNSDGVFSPNAVGSYSLVYSIGDVSCLVSDEVNIQVVALPAVAFTLEDTLFCTSDAAISLTSGTPPGGTYFGSGVNGNQFDPSLTFIGESTIGYSFTDFNGCSNLVDENIAVEICAHIVNSDQSNTFHVYPNPSSGLLNIQLQEGCSFAEMSIFSVDGQLIAQKHLNASTQSFDFSNVSSGAYIIRLQNNKEIISLPWYKFN